MGIRGVFILQHLLGIPSDLVLEVDPANWLAGARISRTTRTYRLASTFSRAATLRFTILAVCGWDWWDRAEECAGSEKTVAGIHRPSMLAQKFLDNPYLIGAKMGSTAGQLPVSAEVPTFLDCLM